MVFTAILSLTLIPVNAWHYPGPGGGTDDLLSEAFGPRAKEIAITVYGTQPLEYLAFKAGDIDIMDWPLTPAQKDELDTEDPDQLTYARAAYTEFGMREIDLHNLAGPCTDVEFRQALSRCIDKSYFIATELAGLGLKMDSPLASKGDPWYYHYCDDLYPYSLADAAAQLDAAGYKDYDDDGWRDYPDGSPITLLFWVRADDPQRTALGVYFTNQLEVALAAIEPEFAGIDVDLRIEAKSTCFDEVMAKYNYDMYTGGWSFGRDPDTLYFLYDSAFAFEFLGVPDAPNYPGYMSADFDVAIEDCVFGENIADSIEAAHLAQKIMMDDACIIPVWCAAGDSAYLSTLEHVCKSVGYGPSSWYTFLNAYPKGTPFGGTIRWGFMNDFEALNVVHSEWVWDWQILDKLYDTLISYNPYNIAEDWSWIAKSWDVDTYEHPDYGTCTKVTFHLRNDVYWQDLPYKADRVMPDDYSLPGPVTGAKVTAEDVAFTWEYIRDVDGGTAWNQGAAADLVSAEVVDDYTVVAYMDVLMPLWAAHWVGGLPLMPKYIWEHVSNATAYDPLAQKTLVGCGPYEFDYDRMVPHEYYYLNAYRQEWHIDPVTGAAVIDKYGYFKEAPVAGTVEWVKQIPGQAVELEVHWWVHSFKQEVLPAGSVHWQLKWWNPNIPGWEVLRKHGAPVEGVIDHDIFPCIEYAYVSYVDPPAGLWCTNQIALDLWTEDPLHTHAECYVPLIWTPADADGDGYCAGIDQGMLGTYWLGEDIEPPTIPPYNILVDFDLDGYIGGTDQGIMGMNWLNELP